MPSRVRLLLSAVLISALVGVSAPALSSTTADRPTSAVGALRALERAHGARLGVYAVDVRTGRTVGYRAGQRFAYASTLKALTAAAFLERTRPRLLRTVVHFTRADIVANSPVTSQHVATGMTWRAVLDAQIRFSDNTAGNLVMDRLGGPAGVQRALRHLGDRTTVVSRREPELNTAIPGDRRDTTTPRQMTRDLRASVLGGRLDRRDHRLLLGLLRTNTTGDATIRAGVPTTWTVGDKTGSADYGTRNDVAVVWPRRGGPIVITVFTTHADPTATTDDALVAAATRVAVRHLRRGR